MSTSTVGIIGAGTMGEGIAQVAAQHGWNVELYDINPEQRDRAITTIHQRLDRLVEKERLTGEQARAARDRVHAATDAEDFHDAELVVEAVIEDLGAKSQAIHQLSSALRPDVIIASNTSSLSITEFGRRLGRPGRTVGMHFFNPAPLMRLVEVVAGDDTEPAVVDRVAEIAESWGKVVARAADKPGFIVNHVARPYYLESFRVLEDGYARVDVIDRTLTEIAGFRMGPFVLTDLIGQDVNLATTRSVWDRLDHPPLLHPSRMQEQLVHAGCLGRKTNRGAYDYVNDPPTPALHAPSSDYRPNEVLNDRVTAFAQAAVGDKQMTPVQQYIIARVLAAVITQALLGHERGIATREDIDTAMKHGANYPKGPFEWLDEIGIDRYRALIEELNRRSSDKRFALPRSLLAHSGGQNG